MAKKPQSRNSPSKTVGRKNINYRPVLLVTIVVAALAIIVLLIWPLIRNDTLYSVDKGEVRADIVSLLDKVNPPGELAYTDIVDLGCDSGGSVGLASVIHCDYMGYKYFVHQGDLSSDLHAVDSVLKDEGWKDHLLRDQTSEGRVQTLHGTEENSLLYQYDNSRISVSLGYYIDTARKNDLRINAFIKEGKIPAPNSVEYVYGLRVTGTYWACTSQSFKPCPASPSKAEPNNT